jgi:hypothetical protein
MIMKFKKKKLVDVDLATWAGVKHFATIQDVSVNMAVELLLKQGLSDYQYTVKKKAMFAGKTLATSQQQTSQLEVH